MRALWVGTPPSPKAVVPSYVAELSCGEAFDIPEERCINVSFYQEAKKKIMKHMFFLNVSCSTYQITVEDLATPIITK